MYGFPRIGIGALPLTLPANLRFQWENPGDLPRSTPQITFRPTRNRYLYDQYGIPLPQSEMHVRTAPQRFGGRTRGPPPEEHRRRKDAKLDIGYNRVLRLINRTYGRASEYLEFQHAFQHNETAYEIATALAINEAIDHSYGARGRFLRDEVYRSGYWHLPVGYDTLSRLWR